MSETYLRVQIESDHLFAVLESGQAVHVEPSIPLPGILRRRCRLTTSDPGPTRHASGLLQSGFVDGQPARLALVEDGVILIEGDGVHARWREDARGFECGPYRRFDEPSGGGPPFVSGYRAAGDGTGARWTEIVELAPDCGVYGGGESYQGINVRGRHRRLRNTEIDRAAGRDTSYLNVPLLWTDAGWGYSSTQARL